jgi:hypothetical protein
MDKKKSPDEQPKSKIARQVTTPKRRYFVPAFGVSVEADSAQDAVEEAKKAAKPEVGDAE